jgi:translocator protein
VIDFMILSVVAVALTALGFACSLFVIVHAFRRSLGTGCMVLFVPCYVVYYAFTQFEHPRKGPIVSGFLGCLILGGVLQSIAAGAL